MKSHAGCLLGLAVALIAASGLADAIVYVDASRPKDSGDGASWATAFHTIQEGVEAAVSGGTVLVAPGTYDEGVSVAGGHNNRVFINKPLTLKSSKGKAVTEIVGAPDPDTAKAAGLFGVGPKAIRCVLVEKASDEVVIEGFTLRDGASNAGSDTMANWGGGVSLADTTVSGPAGAYKTMLVDCTVRDCVGTRGGGVRKVRAVRTLFDNCASFNGTGTRNGAIARDGQFYWCVFRDSRQNVSALSDVTLVNCTVVGCEGMVFQKYMAVNNVYNTYVALNSGASGDTDISFYSSVVSAPSSKATYDGACKTDSDGYQLMGPAVSDFRPIAGGDLVGTGARAHLDLIPADYRDRDFLGNAVAASGNIQVGAVQTTATPQGGRLDFVNFNSTNVTVTLDGCAIHCPSQYVYAAAWPTQYVATVSAVSGAEFWGWHETTSDQAKFPELTNVKTLLMPPASGAHVYEPILAAKSYYVAPGGDDENNDGSADEPFETLQKVNEITAAGVYVLAHAAAGTYDKGGYSWCDVTNRLSIRRNIRYLGAGAGKSFIMGAADPAGADTHSGCGAAAIRCVAAQDVFCAVQGFTLQDGHSTIGGVQQSEKVTATGNGIRGGGFYALSGKPQLLDCVITNASASRGAAAYGGRLVRCQVVDCELMANCSGNAIVRSGQAWGCTFVKVRDGGTAVLHTEAKYCHCSLVLESDNIADLNDDSKVRVYNSLCYGRPFVGNGTVYFGCVAHTTDPLQVGYVDAVRPDFRITTMAPALGAGVATDDADYALLCDWSLDGARPLYVNGKPTAGAYQNPVRVFTLSDPNDPSIGGTFYSAVGETVSLPLDTRYTTRNLIGATVDGKAVQGRTIELRGADWPLPCNRTIPIVQQYATNWYVNAAALNDAGDGFTPATAKKTLKGVLTADLLAGDVVHAAAGTYGEETMVQTEKYSPQSSDPTIAIPSRAVVPQGVTLVGDAGRDVTFIKGQLDTSNPDQLGCGDNAVRCVCLSDGATLEGFTLLEGATLMRTVGSDNSVGGGVIARRADDANAAVVRNCTITNCAATRGGAGFGGRYENCRIVGNRATNNGTLRECAACNCFFDGNRSAQVVGYTYGDIVNCTFTSNNLAMVGTKLTPQAGVSSMQKGCVANCVFLAPVNHAMTAATNNYFAAGATATVAAGKDNVIAEPGRFAFTADGAPVVGSCIAVDAADPSFYPLDLATSVDIAGHQRVWNGRLDAGAVEGDWRPAYARNIKTRRCTVTEATPGVEETVDKAVRLPDGARLTAALSNAAEVKTPYVVRVNITGAGTLTVELNGAAQTWTVDTPGAHELRFENALAANTLRFGFAGEGAADVLGVKTKLGLMLMVK